MESENVEMPSIIAEDLVHITAKIENQWGETGTGFFVLRSVDERGGKVFLLTNKHVLSSDPARRTTAAVILLHLNIKSPDGTLAGQVFPFSLVSSDGHKVWKEHPDQEVDVIAFEVTPLFILNPQIANQPLHTNAFADLTSNEISFGDDVITLGYPGVSTRHQVTNLPFLRSGMIASRIGEPLVDVTNIPGGGQRARVLRGFLIDGGLIPGSSGSPVILKPDQVRTNRDSVMQVSNPKLLGIVAETRYTAISTTNGPVVAFAGLGLAFDVTTITETIGLFFSSSAVP